MTIRKAQESDIMRVAEIYDLIIDSDCGTQSRVCWEKGVYPTSGTARAALARGDLFVMTEDGRIVASAIINQIQPESYKLCKWRFSAKDSEVMVLHTLCVAPEESGKGYGGGFVRFYESCARERSCTCLRMDTNARNINARQIYKKFGYAEADIVPCDFNGIKNIELVCLEKKI